MQGWGKRHGCQASCIGLVAVLLGLVYTEPARRISPLYLGDLLKFDKRYQEFVDATQETLRSKRVLGSALVHEATDNSWLQDGLILDLGVFLGSSTRLLAHLLGNRTTVHGFDTFSGFPEGETWHIDDFAYPTLFSHDEIWVKTLVSEQNLTFVDGKPSTMGFNVKFHKGLTFDTLAKVLDDHPEKPVKFMHIDIDTYEGALHALKTCRKRMVLGTTIVFDDFFVLSGEFKALYDFLQEYPFEFTWTSWGRDIGFMNVVSFKSWVSFVLGWNIGPTKAWQFFMGFRHSHSWLDYYLAVTSSFNNAVGLRITNVGKLHD